MVLDRREAHQQAGTHYAEAGVKAYAVARHGPDGAKFLDPFFQQYLTLLNGSHVVDVGTGAAPWAIFAAQNGAGAVWAVDYQSGMVREASRQIEAAGLEHVVKVQKADGASLPYVGGQMSLALSINVGCNLPLDTKVSEIGKRRLVGFEPHFSEIARVLKVAGRAIVTAPTSFGVVFTDGKRPKEDIFKDIEAAVEATGESTDPEVIKTHLNRLTQVYRATFARRNGRLELTQNEDELIAGEDIWRKLPGLTVPNRYHSEAEYEAAFERVGLGIETAYRVRFGSEAERQEYNTSVPEEKQLGPEYVGNHPFVVWILKKGVI